MDFLNKKEIFPLVKSLCSNNQPFYVEKFRGNTTVVVQKKVMLDVKKSQKDKQGMVVTKKRESSKFKKDLDNQEKAIISFFSNVKKQLNKYLKKQDYNLPDIKAKYPTRVKNWHDFLELPYGTKFFQVDINNCYWQLMEKFGYITNKMYQTYLNDRSFKMYRIMSLTMTISEKTRYYYFKDMIPEKPDLTIGCDTSIYKRLFGNVRCSTINITGHLCNKTLKKQFYGYNTDGMYFSGDENLENVRCLLDRLGLEYKVVVCRKIDNKTIMRGNEFRNF